MQAYLHATTLSVDWIQVFQGISSNVLRGLSGSSVTGRCCSALTHACQVGTQFSQIPEQSDELPRAGDLLPRRLTPLPETA